MGKRAGTMVLVICLAGCLTTHEDASKYEREGVRYGVTEGRFRGRWWNYYERGRSFADGRFWSEAERDLRTALVGRAQDQLWPRTYGLHFVREYFPHRELGIVLYEQGRLDEAIAELETSLSQKHSARAGYYLNETRRAWIESRAADLAPPEIQIAAPAAPVGAMTTTITGTAMDDTFVAKITVNGKPYLIPASAPAIEFAQSVSLAPGMNEIEVIAEDLTGKTTKAVVPIEADLDGPVISFDQPLIIPGVVRGIVFDVNGVSSVSVGGKAATLTPEPDGTIAFSVELAKHELAAPVMFDSKDRLGNSTEGPLPVEVLLTSDTAHGAVFAGYGSFVLPVSAHLNAVVIGGRVVALTALGAADAPEAGPVVKFANLEEGQQYLMDEIVVALEVSAKNPLRELELNGAPLQTIPVRGKTQRLNRRVRLTEGSNEIHAFARDTEGLESQAAVTVERELTEVELPTRQFSVTFAGTVWKGNSPKLDDEPEKIRQRFEKSEMVRDRFTVVDRTMMKEIMDEQALSEALGDKDARLELGRIIPAEAALIGTIRRDAETIEILLDAISTETTEFIAHVDVADRADTDADLNRLIDVLALRMVQEFPKVQGIVAYTESPDVVVTDLTKAHRIRPSMKYVVFRCVEEKYHPTTNAYLGCKTEVLSEALVESVESRKSRARITRWTNETPVEIQEGDQVVTK